MKTHYGFALVLILTSLGGCKKESHTPQVEALFNTPFTLNYLQSAYLPDQATAELTVSLDDIVDTRCPPTMMCLVAGNVQVTVGVHGQTVAKQATLCLGCGASLPDSAAVQVNNRRYVLRLESVTPGAAPGKSDYQANLTVKR
jgi:hypothetical protein